MKQKIIIGVVIFAICMGISFYCGKRSEHFSNKEIDSKWNSLSEESKYEILEYVLKLREVK